MKKGLLCLCFALASMSGWAQGIMGKWITEAGDAQVEIYQQGDKVNGKIVDGDKLKVRGYLGVFYETQTWKRK